MSIRSVQLASHLTQVGFFYQTFKIITTGKILTVRLQVYRLVRLKSLIKIKFSVSFNQLSKTFGRLYRK